MVKHSQPQTQGTRLLSVHAYGAEEERVRTLLQDHLGERLQLSFTAQGETVVTTAAVEKARAAGAVLMVSEREIEAAARQASRQNPRVPLVILPDTRFTPTRGGICFILVVVGAVITISLGRLDARKEKGSDREEPPQQN